MALAQYALRRSCSWRSTVAVFNALSSSRSAGPRDRRSATASSAAVTTTSAFEGSCPAPTTRAPRSGASGSDASSGSAVANDTRADTSYTADLSRRSTSSSRASSTLAATSSASEWRNRPTAGSSSFSEEALAVYSTAPPTEAGKATRVHDARSRASEDVSADETWGVISASEIGVVVLDASASSISIVGGGSRRGDAAGVRRSSFSGGSKRTTRRTAERGKRTPSGAGGRAPASAKYSADCCCWSPSEGKAIEPSQVSARRRSSASEGSAPTTTTRHADISEDDANAASKTSAATSASKVSRSRSVGRSKYACPAVETVSKRREKRDRGSAASWRRCSLLSSRNVARRSGSRAADVANTLWSKAKRTSRSSGAQSASMPRRYASTSGEHAIERPPSTSSSSALGTPKSPYSRARAVAALAATRFFGGLRWPIIIIVLLGVLSTPTLRNTSESPSGATQRTTISSLRSSVRAKVATRPLASSISSADSGAPSSGPSAPA
mmetsp:Transcript_10482/g.42376  ORF Transcript_10482/g.42376 Transcript_10482/m.42376 type:complete len:499 (-) Transcript_10482:1801-3297(-)